MKDCYLFGAGEETPLPRTPKEGDLVIAADGGLARCRELGIVPTLTVGDFDSLGEVPEGENILRLPVEKDDTDMQVAARKGLEMGCDTFYLLGGTGGRADHTIANLQLMHELAGKGALPFLFGKEFVACVIRRGTLVFPEEMRGTLSVFCLAGKAKGVDLLGLYYPLAGGELTFDRPLGVSNSFTGKTAYATVRDGFLTLLWTRQEPLPSFSPLSVHPKADPFLRPDFKKSEKSQKTSKK